MTAPFPLAIWIAYPQASDFRKFELPSLVAYGAALVWTLWMWRLVWPRQHATGA
jgi:hypothetical protein